MNTNYSYDLRIIFINYISELKINNLLNKNAASSRKYDLPAVVVGCELYNIRKVNCSGRIPNYPSFFHTIFAKKCAPIGKEVLQPNGKKFTVGCCAEQRTARDVFNLLDSKQHNVVNFNNLIFSEARRPRTMQIIDYCNNCQKIFD